MLLPLSSLRTAFEIRQHSQKNVPPPLVQSVFIVGARCNTQEQPDWLKVDLLYAIIIGLLHLGLAEDLVPVIG